MARLDLAASEMSEEDYLRECQSRNPEFIKAERDVQKRRQTLFPDESIRLSEFNAEQMAWFEDFINFWYDHPGPVLLGNHDYPNIQPKVMYVRDMPGSWPRDGSIILRVHPTATGDEVKRAYQKIKRRFFPKRLRPDQRRVKLAIYDLYYAEKKAFGEIAKLVKKPVSTVAYLLSSVCHDIGHARGGSREKSDPSFDFPAHFSECPSCRGGRLCSLAEENAGIKAHVQRERLDFSGSIVDEEERQYRKKTGRKLPLKSLDPSEKD
jgi:hypothetical protein